MKHKSLVIKDIKAAANVLRAINHPLRQEILIQLHIRKRLTVGELLSKLEIEQTVCSQHLAILRKVGIVDFLRDGSNRKYYLKEARLENINFHAKELIWVK